MKNQEIELKLTLPDGAAIRPAALRKLLAAPTRATAMKLATTYYDTADCWLNNHGMALRVRHVGNQRIQTLKASKKDLFDKLIGGLGGDFDLSQHFTSLRSLVTLTAHAEPEQEPEPYTLD